jgi:hypothetical protein
MSRKVIAAQEYLRNQRALSHKLSRLARRRRRQMQIKHVVLLKVAPGIALEDIEQTLQGLGSLVGRVAGLLDYSGGANSSPESKARGFTHGFVMTFADAASRDAYLPHPLHIEAAQRLAAILQSGDDAVLVLDWLHEV